MYIDKLDNVVAKCNIAYNRAMTIKAVDVNLGTYFDFDVENIDKEPKFKVGDHVGISKSI